MSLTDHLEGRKSRRSGGGQANAKIAAVVVCITLLVGVGVGLSLLGESALVPTDPASLCPTNAAPASVLVLLLDMSDEFSEPQVLQIRNELTRRRLTVPRFGLIEAYAVDRLGERITKPVLHVCNPGSGKDVNAVYQNPDMAQKKWEAFEAQLNSEFERLMGTEQSRTSPIFEAVQSAALRTLTAPKYDGVPKRLLIVSDLLQNVPGRFNQYRERTSFSDFKKSGYFSDVRADLTGIEVSILYLVRPGTPQDPEHIGFWEQYFAFQGAVLSDVTPVYGAR